jgi:hypothetical protein
MTASPTAEHLASPGKLAAPAVRAGFRGVAPWGGVRLNDWPAAGKGLTGGGMPDLAAVRRVGRRDETKLR